MKTHPLFASLLLVVTTYLGVARADDTAPQPAAQAKQQQTQATPTGDDWFAPPPPAPPPQTPAPQPGPGAKRPATLTPDPANLPANKYAPPQTVTTQTEQAAAPAGQSGQWVYTDQYGWVWIPYAREYTYVGTEGYPYSYCYYPNYGWMWLYSPWVFGWGPGPYWGVYGRGYFAWYARPWFARPSYYPRGGYYGGFRAGAPVRAGYYRGAVGSGVYRGGVVGGGGYRGGSGAGHSYAASPTYHGSSSYRVPASPGGGGGYRAPASAGFHSGGGFHGGSGFHGGGGFRGGGGHMHR